MSNECNDLFAKPVAAENARKRAFRPGLWKRSTQKAERYKPSDPPSFPKCGHASKSYQCGALLMQDVKDFHRNFYLHKTKVDQDNFILKYCEVKEIVRRRAKEERKYTKNCSVKYNVFKVSSAKNISVCRNAFLDILKIRKDRVLGVIKRYRETRQMPRENRGGDRKTVKYAESKASVIKFIEKFKTVESHYCRNRSCRNYLPSDLNIQKMFRLYCKEVESDSSFVMVKKSYFRNIFNTCYNIGFGSPRTDVCSTCLQLIEKIKREENVEVKNRLITERRVHKLRAKAFYDALREEREGLQIISFDCQKNQAMPKIPDQSVYYSRQLYTYNFAAVTGTSNSPLTKENVSLYTWTEDQHRKGANEIASAIFHKLCKTTLNTTETIRLIADGCGGQNKNSIMITMCIKWLSQYAPPSIKLLELIFPVAGHSFIPPDRVFARIEKVIKKKDTIVSPDEYVEIFEEHGTIFKLGTNTDVYEWKHASQTALKPPGQWHFKFNMSKRFILKRGKNNSITIRGEQSYKSDLGEYKSVFKKGMSANNIIPSPLASGVSPKKDKLADVKALLQKHYGANWAENMDLKYYSDVLKKYCCIEESRENNENLLCEPTPEILDLVV